MNIDGSLVIKEEVKKDHDIVGDIIKAAFAFEEMSDQSEHLLVSRLRKTQAFIPALSLVAFLNEEPVGHILLTKIKIVTDDDIHESLALAPVSVLPIFQGKGIGSSLIHHAHRRAIELNYESIILVGHEDYYPRFGYRRLSEFNIALPFEVPDANAMAIELTTESLAEASGRVEYHPTFFE